MMNRDGFGVGLSSLCVVHCLLTPIAVAAFPAFGWGLLADETFHPVLAVFVALSAAMAFSKGFRRHRSYPLVAVACVGLLFLCFAASNSSHQLMTETEERMVTFIGSAWMVAFHYLNWKLGRREAPAFAAEGKAR